MGIGKLVLTEIIERKKERGYKNLFLSVIDSNENAIAFYKNLGFHIHSTTRLNIPYFKEELKGMYIMVKELNR
jgi:ribosomal protein S18 acetylase RimI-like enzyme